MSTITQQIIPCHIDMVLSGWRVTPERSLLPHQNSRLPVHWGKPQISGLYSYASNARLLVAFQSLTTPYCIRALLLPSMPAGRRHQPAYGAQPHVFLCTFCCCLGCSPALLLDALAGRRELPPHNLGGKFGRKFACKNPTASKLCARV